MSSAIPEDRKNCACSTYPPAPGAESVTIAELRCEMKKSFLLLLSIVFISSLAYSQFIRKALNTAVNRRSTAKRKNMQCIAHGSKLSTLLLKPD